MNCIIRETTEIQLYPNNMNREDSFCLNKAQKPLIKTLKEQNSILLKDKMSHHHLSGGPYNGLHPPLMLHFTPMIQPTVGVLSQSHPCPMDSSSPLWVLSIPQLWQVSIPVHWANHCTSYLLGSTPLPWRLRQQIPLKCLLIPPILHGI